MYYPSSGNKGADQLHGYREADLRLCFRLYRLLVFPWGGSFVMCLYQVAYESHMLLVYTYSTGVVKSNQDDLSGPV